MMQRLLLLRHHLMCSQAAQMMQRLLLLLTMHSSCCWRHLTSVLLLQQQLRWARTPLASISAAQALPRADSFRRSSIDQSRRLFRGTSADVASHLIVPS